MQTILAVLASTLGSATGGRDGEADMDYNDREIVQEQEKEKDEEREREVFQVRQS